jgi:hypothetical protein
MGEKEDRQRALEYSQTGYIDVRENIPSYEQEIQKTQKTYAGRSWIKSPFQLPRFTDAAFDAKRQAFQAKYGTKIAFPTPTSIIHIAPPVPISEEEIAAHNKAKRKGLESPLNDAQLEELAKRKGRFLSIVSNVSPAWRLNVTSVLTSIDNAEDALVTAAVLGRLAAKFAPKLFGRLVPGLGWVLLGADILNVATTFSRMTWAGKGAKRSIEGLTDMNPFHAKSYAKRTMKLKGTWPAFSEMLEIAQTVDQMFGVGLCLGSVMGFAQDAFQAGMEQLASFGVKIVGTIQYPSQLEMLWGDALKSLMLMWEAPGQATKAYVDWATIAGESALHAIAPAWFQNDPLKNVMNLGGFPVRMPETKNPYTRATLEDVGIDPRAPQMWPFINTETATIDELMYYYAPKIKENFQTYSLEQQYTYEGLATGHAAVSYQQGVTAAFSDDGQCMSSHTPYAGAAKDMMREILIPPNPGPEEPIEMLKEWLGQYERKYNAHPTTKELQYKGEELGIKWKRTFPSKIYGKAAELFPEWRAIQDQLGELYIAD